MEKQTQWEVDLHRTLISPLINIAKLPCSGPSHLSLYTSTSQELIRCKFDKGKCFQSFRGLCGLICLEKGNFLNFLNGTSTIDVKNFVFQYALLLTYEWEGILPWLVISFHKVWSDAFFSVFLFDWPFRPIPPSGLSGDIPPSVFSLSCNLSYYGSRVLGSLCFNTLWVPTTIPPQHTTSSIWERPWKFSVSLAPKSVLWVWLSLWWGVFTSHVRFFFVGLLTVGLLLLFGHRRDGDSYCPSRQHATEVDLSCTSIQDDQQTLWLTLCGNKENSRAQDSQPFDKRLRSLRLQLKFAIKFFRMTVAFMWGIVYIKAFEECGYWPRQRCIILQRRNDVLSVFVLGWLNLENGKQIRYEEPYTCVRQVASRANSSEPS